MKIAAALQAKLSPAEKEHMERKPTEISEAYLAYERAHDLQSNSYEDIGKLKEGEQTYEDAVQLDPKFALALARYSQLELDRTCISADGGTAEKAAHWLFAPRNCSPICRKRIWPSASFTIISTKISTPPHASLRLRGKVC